MVWLPVAFLTNEIFIVTRGCIRYLELSKNQLQSYGFLHGPWIANSLWLKALGLPHRKSACVVATRGGLESTTSPKSSGTFNI